MEMNIPESGTRGYSQKDPDYILHLQLQKEIFF